MASAAPSASDYESKAQETCPADVRMFSGCKDEQTSADVSNVASFNLPANSGPKGAGGACTNALLANVYNSSSDFTWVGLLRAMQKTLKTKGYTQIPQLSASRAMDLKNDKFSLLNPRSNGNLKALFIGINYIGQQGQLAGCHNDVIGMQKLLDGFGFKRDEGHQRVLMDDGRHRKPTRAEIMEGFRWLTGGAKAGDTLFMHYSGHGGSVRDTSGDEKDGRDETMCPVDFRSAGQIPDDEIFNSLVSVLPKGVTLTVLMDCCHSGSILDLPYSFTATGAQLEAIESGSASPMMQPNPHWAMRLLAAGMAAYSAYQRGGAAGAGAAALRSVGGGGGVARAAGADARTAALVNHATKCCIIQ